MSHCREKLIILSHDGKTLSLTGWANYLGISRQTLHARLKKYRNNLERVLISGLKKRGRPFQPDTQSIPKIDGLAEILKEKISTIQVHFSPQELQRIQEIKRRKLTQ